jgi:hypothetical protein
MGSNDEQLQIIVRAVDEATATLKSVHGLITQLGGTAEESATKTGKLSGALSAFGSIAQGIGIGIGISLFNDLTNAIGRIVDAIPQAVEAGYAWAQQIYQLQIETGMTAEQTSSLAAIMRELGVDMGTADRLFAMFGKNLDTHEKLFTNLGIATRDANGQFLDTYTIIRNLQQAFSSQGDSLAKTAAAQELFSRTGYTMLDFLNLTDAQMRQLTIDAGNAGMVLDQSTTDAAHRFGIEMGNLGNIVTGIQTSIFAGLEPTLEGFVTSFGAYVEAHLNDIVAYAVSVANFVMGVIGGIFGVDFGGAAGGPAGGPGGESSAPAPVNRPAPGTVGAAPAAGGGGGGGSAKDPYAESIKAQTAAISAQIAALKDLQATEQAQQQQADLEKAITDAKTELANLQASSVDTYGLSAAEQIKAQQKREADILAAKDKVQTTEVSLTDWKKKQDEAAQLAELNAEKQHLADLLAAHQAVNGGITAGVGAIAPIVGSTFTGLNTTMAGALKDFTTNATSARDAGVKAGADLRVALAQLLGAMGGLAGAVGVTGGIINTFVLQPLQWLNEKLSPVGGLASMLYPILPLLGWLNGYLNDTGGLAYWAKRGGDALHGLFEPIGTITDLFRDMLDPLHSLQTLMDNISHIDFNPLDHLPHFAEGGSVSKPTLAWLGEGGEREYVIPESKMRQFGIPGGVSAAGAGTGATTLQIMVDKRILGQIVNEAIGRLMPAVTRGLVASS